MATYERLMSRLGAAYIVWMMIVTRLGGLIGGAAVVYYVRLTLNLSGRLQFHFNVVATAVVLAAVTITVLLALWETRNLRAVMRCLQRGHPVPEGMGRMAGREAVVFSVRHHVREAFVVPLVCLPPVYLYLSWAANAPTYVLVHITIATFLGVSCSVLMTYFIIERAIQPVIQHLLNYGVVIEYESLPTGRLHHRLIFVYTLIIVSTAVMIATLANQKVADLGRHPAKLDEVIASLRMQTIAISAGAVVLAVILSTLLARSVTIRVQDIVGAMHRVELGNLDERIPAVSTDEVGMVGRSFNRMVAQLEHSQAIINELNTSLELKVRQRNQELETTLAELKRTQDSLINSQKMSSLGQLVAGIAHEINNATNAVYNGIQPLKDEVEAIQELLSCALPPEPPASGDQTAERPVPEEELRTSLSAVNELVAAIESGAKRTADIVTNLKKFAHPGKGTRSLFSVHEALNVALGLVSNKLKNRVGIHRDFCDDGMIMCSGTELTQVFLNLIDNAQQAIAGPGHLFISTRRTAQDMVIKIRDTGTGIPQSIKDQIFDPFFTTKDVGVGTGLGLSIAYGTIKGHGGTIDVISPPPDSDRGAEFTVTLPLASTGDARSDSANPAAKVSPTNGPSERSVPETCLAG